jgi:Ca2+-transporting ATPase
MTPTEQDKMSDKELQDSVKDVTIFSRVIPEHKMRIVKAFKQNGEIVAMTGDGVNDAPALKYADIGIAMGKRGSEVSREAADLILLDDNFSTIVDTVKDGRRIYDNIRKAIGYIFVIHIPIALSSLLGPLLSIKPSFLLLLPIHVVLLELIIDPTCSVVLERQPAEQDIMDRNPRDPKEQLLTPGILIKSIFQGLIIFLASFMTYYIALNDGNVSSLTARSMGLVIVMLANLFLVWVNSSNSKLVYKTLGKLIKDKVMMGINLGTIVGIMIILYSPINIYLKLSPLTIKELLLTILIAFISVFTKYDKFKQKKTKI